MGIARTDPALLSLLQLGAYFAAPVKQRLLRRLLLTAPFAVARAPLQAAVDAAFWRGVRGFAQLVPRWRDPALSFGGPLMLVMNLILWFAALIVGFGLLVWPSLGTGIRSATEPTPRDFVTALYVAGDSLTTVGSGDTAPRTAWTKILMTAASATGFCTITLVVTYFLQVYNALLHRNALALRLHHATGGSGDAADLLAGLGAAGSFDAARAELVELSRSFINLYEAHHFYSVLLYFRFKEPHYALARAAAVTMELPTLLWTALDEQKYAEVRKCIGARAIWDVGLQLLDELEKVFLPRPLQEFCHRLDDAKVQRWRARYRDALARLRAEGIQTVADEEAGARSYIELRQKWDPYITEFAAYMLQDLTRADPAARQPGRTLSHGGVLAPGTPGGGGLNADHDQDEQEALSRI